MTEKRGDRAIIHQFTAPDNGLIRAVAPNIRRDSSSVHCFTVMFANEVFNSVVTDKPLLSAS
jgi:hypothetical protein